MLLTLKKELYIENYNTVMKEIEEDINKWKNILCPWTGKATTAKCPYYPKQSINSVQSWSKFHSTSQKKKKNRTNSPKKKKKKLTQIAKAILKELKLETSQSLIPN